MKRTLLFALLLSGTSFAQIPTDNLLVHMKFESNLVNEADASTGTIMGNAGSVIFDTDRFGNPSRSLLLGNNPAGYISLDDIALNDPDYTISFWIKHTQVPSGKQFRVLSKREACTGGSLIDITLDANTQDLILESYAQGDYTANINDAFVSTVNWAHVVLVVDQANSQTRFYLNGNLYSTANWTNSLADGTMDNSASFIIGSSPCVNGTSVLGYNGLLDDIRVYSRSLNANEVSALYNEPNPTAGIEDMDLNSSISIYPNPANSILNIELTNAEKVFITDLTGSIVLESGISSLHTLDVSTFSKGIYLVKTASGTTQKFIKQ